jgi:hypothetical protein
MTKSDIVKQELKDFKEEVISRLTRIEEKITFTNGKIAKAVTDIELGKQQRRAMVQVCEKNHSASKDWKMMFATATVTAIVVFTVTYIGNRMFG